MAETVILQVICNGQVLAQTDFTYFGDSVYYSEMLYQFLSHNMPTYFQQSDLGMGRAGLMEGGAEGGGGGYTYCGDIPSSTYGLFLGACRLGLEPFIYATLQLPAMSKISSEQLGRAKGLAEEFGHEKLSQVLGQLETLAAMTSRGEGEEENTVQYCETLEELDRGGHTPEGDGFLNLISLFVPLVIRLPHC